MSTVDSLVVGRFFFGVQQWHPREGVRQDEVAESFGLTSHFLTKVLVEQLAPKCCLNRISPDTRISQNKRHTELVGRTTLEFGCYQVSKPIACVLDRGF